MTCRDCIGLCINELFRNGFYILIYVDEWMGRIAIGNVHDISTIAIGYMGSFDIVLCGFGSALLVSR